MKHIFMINPEAGRGGAETVLVPRILKAAKEAELDYEIHRAMTLESGAQFVRKRCETGLPVRFYACGGDGTVNSVLNGVMGFRNAQLAVIPAGTGNDFVRSFKHSKYFSHVERQIDGTEILLDVLKYNKRYALNMLNVGMDCSVVSQAALIKKRSLLGERGAYLGGIANVLFKGPHFPMTMEFEGGEVLEGDFLLLTVANGCFCGGGFKGAPRARMNDGFFDVCIVRQINRIKLLPLLLKYRAGSHLVDEECRKYLTYKQCQKMTFSPQSQELRMDVAADGEVDSFESVTVELIPESVRFVLPRGASL